MEKLKEQNQKLNDENSTMKQELYDREATVNELSEQMKVQQNELRKAEMILQEHDSLTQNFTALKKDNLILS